MAKNPILLRNEDQTTIIVARVLRWCILFFLLMIVLRLFGVFSTPIGQYLAPFAVATLLLVVPTALAAGNAKGPWLKYIIVTVTIGAAASLFVNYWEIGRFMEMLWLFPVIIACAYVSPNLTIYAFLTSLAVMNILFAIAMGSRPANYWEFVTTHNLFGDLLLRDIILCIVTGSLYALTTRFHRIFQDLIGVEEQNAILTRLAMMVNGSSKAAQTLVTSVDNMTQVSQYSSTSAMQTVALGRQLAVGAEETLYFMRQAGPAIVSMAGQITDLAGSINQLADAAQTMGRIMAGGRDALLAATGQMREITEITMESKDYIAKLGKQSATISDIVQVITNIARQTKILALNASIEAARAGEGGRGFQAVALSIRDLAAQASQAAESITELISSMQEQAEQTINSIDLGNQQVDNGLQAIKSVEDAFYQAASAEESVQTQVEQFDKTLTQIVAYSDLIVASTRNIESRSENGLNDARGIANATQEQLANIRQIRQELASLQHTAEQLRDLGNT